jgi:hypothetical protein
MTALELLLAYKQQPMIEKRFVQLKTDFVVAPVFLKEVSRAQALLCAGPGPPPVGDAPGLQRLIPHVAGNSRIFRRRCAKNRRKVGEMCGKKGV